MSMGANQDRKTGAPGLKTWRRPGGISPSGFSMLAVTKTKNSKKASKKSAAK